METSIQVHLPIIIGAVSLAGLVCVSAQAVSAAGNEMRAPHSFSFCDSVLFETTKAQVKLLECLSFSSNRQEAFHPVERSSFWILVISIVRSWYISMRWNFICGLLVALLKATAPLS